MVKGWPPMCSSPRNFAAFDSLRGEFSNFRPNLQVDCVLASQVLMCDLSLATGGCMQGKEAWDMMMASSICINIHPAHTCPA